MPRLISSQFLISVYFPDQHNSFQIMWLLSKVPSLLWGPKAEEEISTLTEWRTTFWACSRSWSQFNSVQLLSRVQLFATLWAVACEAFLSITNSQRLLKLMSIESMMPSNHLILCLPLLPLPSIFSASGSFPVSQPFTSAGQSNGASASAIVLPVNI